MPDDQIATREHELLAAERDAALREAFARLPPAGQRLLAMLISAPQCRTTRSAPSSAYRPRASGRTAAATWTGCATTRHSPA